MSNDKQLNVQSCKLYNNKYMNTDIFAFISVLVFRLLSSKFCLLTEKTTETVKKQATF